MSKLPDSDQNINNATSSDNRKDRLHPDARDLLREGAREYASLLKPTMKRVYQDFGEHFDKLNEARAEKGLGEAFSKEQVPATFYALDEVRSVDPELFPDP